MVGGMFGIESRNWSSGPTWWPTSLYPHGVFCQKDSEGAPHEDGTEGADKADDGVPTGSVHTNCPR